MKVKFLGGVLVLAAVAVIVAIIVRPPPPPPPPVTTVTGFAGNSKKGLLEDQEVKDILLKNHNLKVDANYDSEVCGMSGDFLWPGADFAVEEYEACKGISRADADSVLTSPLVFYAWEEVADALIREKLVENRGGVYYATDLSRLFQMLHDHKKWREIGVNIEGDVAVIPAAPSSADSGLLFAAMMANKKLNGVANVDTLPLVLPEIVEYFTSLGFLQPSSDALFKKYLATGIGDHPLIVVYESLLPSFIYSKALTCDKIQKMRVIYPEPTVWASHPMIAQTPNGRPLLTALLTDQKIQELAWQRYGLRTFLGGIQPKSSVCLPMPGVITGTTRLPDYKTMEMLKSALP